MLGFFGLRSHEELTRRKTLDIGTSCHQHFNIELSFTELSATPTAQAPIPEAYREPCIHNVWWSNRCGLVLAILLTMALERLKSSYVGLMCIPRCTEWRPSKLETALTLQASNWCTAVLIVRTYGNSTAAGLSHTSGGGFSRVWLVGTDAVIDL